LILLSLLGKVVSFYGRSGEVKVQLVDENRDEAERVNFCFVDFFGDKKKLAVQSAKLSGKFLILSFKSFDTKEASAVFIGKDIYIEKHEADSLLEYNFLIKDLLKSKVFAGNVLLGEIVDVLSLPSNDVYVLEDSLGKEILVPAIKDIIERFDNIEKKLYLKVEKSYFEDDEN